MSCLFCQSKADSKEIDLSTIEVNCKNCHVYRYEKSFLTTLNFFMSTQSSENQQKILKQMKKMVKNSKVCFVNDFEKTTMEGFDLIELADILDACKIDVAHNNVIDSNYKD